MLVGQATYAATALDLSNIPTIFLNAPDVIGKVCGRRERGSRPSWKAGSQASEATHSHSHRYILAFDLRRGRGDVARIRVALYDLPTRGDDLCGPVVHGPHLAACRRSCRERGEIVSSKGPNHSVHFRKRISVPATGVRGRSGTRFKIASGKGIVGRRGKMDRGETGDVYSCRQNGARV
jgi:hypothetical protein